MAVKETIQRIKFPGTLRTPIYSARFRKSCGKWIILWNDNFMLTSLIHDSFRYHFLRLDKEKQPHSWSLQTYMAHVLLGNCLLQRLFSWWGKPWFFILSYLNDSYFNLNTEGFYRLRNKFLPLITVELIKQQNITGQWGNPIEGKKIENTRLCVIIQ